MIEVHVISGPHPDRERVMKALTHLFEEDEWEGKRPEVTIRRRVYTAQSLPDFVMDIMRFHEKYGLDYNGKPRLLDDDLMEYRLKFMHEELDEWQEHCIAGNKVRGRMGDDRDEADITHHLEETLDAGVDLMYVLLGTMYLQGLLPYFEEAWRRVHHANMQKVRQRGQADVTDSGREPKFDVVKPAGWTPPTHTDLVEDHAHRIDRKQSAL